MAGPGEKERDLVLKALSAHPFYTKDEEPYECSACRQTGVVYCELKDSGQPEFDYEQVDFDEFVYHGGFIDRTAYGVNFNCDACGLDLDYDEMTAADMLTEYEREPRDCEPWEFEEPDRD